MAVVIAARLRPSAARLIGSVGAARVRAAPGQGHGAGDHPLVKSLGQGVEEHGIEALLADDDVVRADGAPALLVVDAPVERRALRTAPVPCRRVRATREPPQTAHCARPLSKARERRSAPGGRPGRRPSCVTLA
jgi:hypothetical protein